MTLERTYLITITIVLLAFVTAMVPAQAVDSGTEKLPSLDGQRIETREGDSFEIRTRIGAISTEDVRIFFPEFPAGIAGVENPTLLRRGRDAIEIRIPFVATEPGRYVVEGITIQSEEGFRDIEAVLISVATSDGSEVPLRGEWQIPGQRIIQSQSAPIVLTVVGAEDYIYPEEITYTAPDTGLFEEVSGLGSVATRVVGATTLYDIPVAGFIFTPATSGRIALPDASFQVGNQRVDVPSREIDVMPLPEIVATSSNAVGRFVVENSIDLTQVQPGEPVTLDIVVSGNGNLPVIDLPGVTTEGLVVIEENDTAEIQPDQSSSIGYTGTRRRTIRFETAEEATSATIVLEEFPYFDPTTERIVRIGGEVFELTVSRDIQPQSKELPNLPLLTIDELLSPRWYRVQEIPWILYALLIGPLFFAIASLWSVRRRDSNRAVKATIFGLVPLLLGAALFPTVHRDRIENAMRLVEEGRPAVAAVLFDLEIGENGWHAGLHYNRGVLGVRTDRPVIATYHLRRAVRLAPDNPAFRSALDSASDHFDLNEQVPIPSYPRLDYFIIGLMMLWTIFWFVLSARRRLRNTLGLIVVVVAFVAVGAGALWIWSLDRQQDGVIREAIHVRRIPDMSATPWIALAQAQAVRIELQYEGFYLVRTQTGMTGWVPRDAILSTDRRNR